MVDHNEVGQAVDGIEEAEVVEIIDHHRLGARTTSLPDHVHQPRRRVDVHHRGGPLPHDRDDSPGP